LPAVASGASASSVSWARSAGVDGERVPGVGEGAGVLARHPHHLAGAAAETEGQEFTLAAAARWRAQRATQNLLTDPYRAKSPVTGDPLIAPS
jgi:hypothetical protein